MKGKKLSDGKTVGGRGQLTDKVIDKMQNYYGKAIRGNKGNLEGMKLRIKAIQQHIERVENFHWNSSISTKSADTWCKYCKDKNDETQVYNEDNQLPEVFMDELDPIFTRLSKDASLPKYVFERDHPESEWGSKWHTLVQVSETKFWGARRVRIAACETITVLHTGDLCGCYPLSPYNESPQKAGGCVKWKNAAKKVSEKYRKKRQ